MSTCLIGQAMSEVNLDEYRNVGELFRKHHVGSIEKMMRKLDQNYVKILEAYSAVDMMKDAAASIDNLLGSLDDAIVAELDEEVVPEKGLPSKDREYYEKYQMMWSEMQDSNYQSATKLLIELGEFEMLASEVHRVRSILLQLCERCLLDRDTNVQELVEAVKSIAILKDLQPTAVYKDAIILDPKSSNSVLADSLERTKKCCSALNIPPKDFLENILANLNLAGEKALGVAIYLQKKTDDELLKSIATRLFNQWVDTLPAKANHGELFQICKILTAASETDLPPEWRTMITAKLPVETPPDCGLLMAPLFGCPHDIPPTDADEMEKLFVPMGLPRILKLPIS